MHQFAGLLSVLLVVIGISRYVVAILSKKATPSQSTWWIFTCVSILILVTTLLSDTPNPSIWQLWIFAGTAFIIAVLSMFYGKSGWGFYDKACTVVAVCAIGIWIFLWNNPDATKIVLILAIIARFMGIIPTITKAYADPQSEDVIAWIILSSATLVNLLAVEVWDWQRWTIAAFPVYAVLECLPVIILILWPKLTGKKLRLS